MTSIFKHSLFLLVTLVAAGIFVGCSEDDLANGGKPTISYIRVTDPASSDSLLISAGQGQMIVIMGENLADINELWFNDQRASLNPSFITNTSVITRVPSQIPTEITDKMVLYFGNGQKLEYDFSVDISEPLISYMKSEYVNTGDVASVHGDYFYEPITVTFTGGAQGEIVTLEDDVIGVRIPEGAQPGPITVTTNFGVTTSDFWFHDDRNVIASFDGPTAGLWHGPAFIVESDDVIPAIDGKFVRVTKSLGAWGWFEMYVGPADSDAALELKKIPADAFANPGDYSLKFELNTLKSLSGANIRMYIGPDMPGERGTFSYNWQPNINTEGEWETVSIPWEDVYVANQEFDFNPAGYGISMHFSGPNAVEADFALDNMRVVRNSND
jgi:hypothetical protein